MTAISMNLKVDRPPRTQRPMPPTHLVVGKDGEIMWSVKFNMMTTKSLTIRRRKRSDSVLWQKPLHLLKNPKGKVTTQKTPSKTSLTQRLRTDLGRSFRVPTVTLFVWFDEKSDESDNPYQNEPDDYSLICKLGKFNNDDYHETGPLTDFEPRKKQFNTYDYAFDDDKKEYVRNFCNRHLSDDHILSKKK